MYGRVETVETADNLKDAGFHFATKSSVTMNIFDLNLPAQKEEILDIASEKVNDVHNFWFK